MQYTLSRICRWVRLCWYVYPFLPIWVRIIRWSTTGHPRIYIYIYIYIYASGSISGKVLDIYIYIYIYISSTLPEIDPDTAYVVCISVSLGFRQKPSDTALLSVIALTTFNYIVSASVTKGVLLCFVVTVHWWRHRTHYDVTEAYRALRNILTVDLNNGATGADMRGIPKTLRSDGESRALIDIITTWRGITCRIAITFEGVENPYLPGNVHFQYRP